MAKAKASDLAKLQALIEASKEEANLLKLQRKYFDNLCRAYFGKSSKEIELILSDKTGQESEPIAEQEEPKTEAEKEPEAEPIVEAKVEQKAEAESESKTEVETRQEGESKTEAKSEPESNDYTDEFAKMYGLNK